MRTSKTKGWSRSRKRGNLVVLLRVELEPWPRRLKRIASQGGFGEGNIKRREQIRDEGGFSACWVAEEKDGDGGWFVHCYNNRYEH